MVDDGVFTKHHQYRLNTCPTNTWCKEFAYSMEEATSYRADLYPYPDKYYIYIQSTFDSRRCGLKLCEK